MWALATRSKRVTHRIVALAWPTGATKTSCASGSSFFGVFDGACCFLQGSLCSFCLGKLTLFLRALSWCCSSSLCFFRSEQATAFSNLLEIPISIVTPCIYHCFSLRVHVNISAPLLVAVRH